MAKFSPYYIWKVIFYVKIAWCPDTSWAGLQGLVTLRRFRRAPQTAIPVLRNLRGFPWQALTLLKALKVHQAWWVGRGNMGGLVTVDMVRKWWTIERINKKVVWWWCIKEKRRLGTASETFKIWWMPRRAGGQCHHLARVFSQGRNTSVNTEVLPVQLHYLLGGNCLLPSNWDFVLL